MASIRTTRLVTLLSIVICAFCHSEDEMAPHSGESHDGQTPETDPAAYVTLDDHQLAIRFHISLMFLSWFIILPIATMLSLARSRYTPFLRLVFTATNIIGVLCGVAYKNNTPDLYPGSAHSAVGWIATGIAAAQVSHLLVDPVSGLFNRLRRNKTQSGRHTLSPMREGFHGLQDHDGPSGLSRHISIDVEATQALVEDRGSDTSQSSRLYQEDAHEFGFTRGDDTCFEESDSIRALHHDPSAAFSKVFSRPLLSRTRRFILFMYDLLDRTILIVGFVAFCTGLVTFWGIFKGHNVFNGVAHWIKGGVFFWLGIFNLGRWCGCFAEKGWAWNIRHGSPKTQLWLSAEMVESSLIFIYGSTNIFLEHLSGWGKAWTPRDLEHLSITVLFIGGGLCGMLVEYIRVRGLGEQRSRPLLQSVPGSSCSNGATDEDKKHISSSTGLSMNPLPALVIFLVGGVMSSHEQASMVSTMIHKQWGNLLGAAAVARLLTYITLYLKPPTSTSPSRPPTELLSSFCLMSGGILFMASSFDTVDAMIRNDIDVMALYTVTMGFTGILMAWVIGLLVLKDRAAR